MPFTALVQVSASEIFDRPHALSGPQYLLLLQIDDPFGELAPPRGAVGLLEICCAPALEASSLLAVD
jgi:hypothetical protein